MSSLPEPLVHADLDLRDFAFMPLDVVRLRDSELAAKVSGEDFRCAVLLWCASWHQIPAGSLPDDDTLLARLAGFGRAIKEWKQHREGSLWGWIKCNDGRLYHPTVTEKATEAWNAKQRQRNRTRAARDARLSHPAPSSVTDDGADCNNAGIGHVAASKGRDRDRDRDRDSGQSGIIDAADRLLSSRVGEADSFVTLPDTGELSQSVGELHGLSVSSASPTVPPLRAVSGGRA